MSKITEKIIEPSSRVDVGSTFKIKVKAIRYAPYEEFKTKLVSKIDDYFVAQLKGE